MQSEGLSRQSLDEARDEVHSVVHTYLKVPSRHDLVRRYTDQLDEDRRLLEVGNSQEFLQKGQALYKQ